MRAMRVIGQHRRAEQKGKGGRVTVIAHRNRRNRACHARFWESAQALLSLAEACVLHLHGQIEPFPVASDWWEMSGTTCCRLIEINEFACAVRHSYSASNETRLY